MYKAIDRFEKNPEDVAQWMLDRKITGTKEDMVSKLLANAEKSKNSVDEAIASVK